jgi:hypothetical protein
MRYISLVFISQRSYIKNVLKSISWNKNDVYEISFYGHLERSWSQDW